MNIYVVIKTKLCYNIPFSSAEVRFRDKCCNACNSVLIEFKYWSKRGPAIDNSDLWSRDS